ncbi:hypothetical protein NQZ68_031024 [Dissostichus eleginoides]|nr:hypothetical protein NQZ68_031024 [Dissostichus eleginoides]
MRRLRIASSASGGSFVIGPFCCLSNAHYLGIGSPTELCSFWLYLSLCERLRALPASREAPASSFSSKEERRNCPNRM